MWTENDVLVAAIRNAIAAHDLELTTWALQGILQYQDDDEGEHGGDFTSEKKQEEKDDRQDDDEDEYENEDDFEDNKYVNAGTGLE